MRKRGGVVGGGPRKSVIASQTIADLLLVSPSAVKVYLAAVHLGSASSLQGLADMARLARHTVIEARRELVERNLFQCSGDVYVIPPRPSSPSPKATVEIPPVEDRRVAVQAACRTLGVAPTAGYVRLALAKLTALLEDGATSADALEVARYTRAAYDGGDRFKPHLDLLYVWSVGKFAPLLAASRTTPAATKDFRVMDAGTARDDWDDAFEKKLRDRGLA